MRSLSGLPAVSGWDCQNLGTRGSQSHITLCICTHTHIQVLYMCSFVAPHPRGQEKGIARKQKKNQKLALRNTRCVSGSGQAREKVESQCFMCWWWLGLSSTLPFRGLESDFSHKACSPLLQQDSETRPSLVVSPSSSSRGQQRR